MTMSSGGFRQALTFFCTRDLAAAHRFYGELLGLERVLSLPMAALYHVAGTAYFGVTAKPGREPKPGAALLELVVDDRAAVDRWHRAIAEAGYAVDAPPRDMDTVYGFFATAPDGYLVEILHAAEPAVLGLKAVSG